MLRYFRGTPNILTFARGCLEAELGAPGPPFFGPACLARWGIWTTGRGVGRGGAVLEGVVAGFWLDAGGFFVEAGGGFLAGFLGGGSSPSSSSSSGAWALLRLTITDGSGRVGDVAVGGGDDGERERERARRNPSELG